MGVQFAGNILVQSNGGPLPISQGGTGQTTAPNAINALMPTQSGNSGKVLTTNGSVVSWSTIGAGTPGGSDTQIQYNDSGTFGGNAFLTVNKSTGAITSTSTLTNQGLVVTNSAATYRSIKLQTAGSDRWLLQANNVAESGANSGTNFEFTAVADNGATQNQVFTVSRSTRVLDFKQTPTINGVAISTGGTPGGSDTQIQYNSSGTFAGSSSFTFDGTNKVNLAGILAGADGGTNGTGGLTIRSGNPANGTPGALFISGGTSNTASAAGSVTVTGGSSSVAGNGGALTLSGGTPGAPGATAGTVTIHADASGAGVGGAINIRGGDTATNSVDGGTVTIRGGNSQNGSTSGNGGNVVISGGFATTVGVGGYIALQTGVTGSVTERLRVANDGTITTATGTSVDFGARYTELNSAVTAAASTSINCALGNNFTVSMGASITTLSFTNVPASGRVYSMTLFLAYTGSFNVTWPASVKWAGGSAPTLTSANGKADIITLVTKDNGTTWYGFVAGLNF